MRGLGTLGLGLLLLGGCQSDAPIGATDDQVDAGADLARPGPIGDALPIGAITYFNRKDCPPGWQLLDAATGRTIVPSSADTAGVVAGTPLAEREERKHGHKMTATMNLSSVNYAGIAGEGNHGVAHDGTVTLKVTGGDAVAGLPYVQLLICEKTQAPPPTEKRPPAGTRVFFNAKSCPVGWGETRSAVGRFLVGVPMGSTANQTFGGPPLASGELRTHTHKLGGMLKTHSHGILLAGGGLAGGYAKDDTYPYQGQSEGEDAGLPYVQLLQCQKL